MKTRHFLLFTLVLSLFTACSSDDGGTTPTNNGILEDGESLQGTIVGDLTVRAGTHALRGDVVVEDGATLTIEAGTTFIARNADGLDVLIIKQGGTIIANGTAANPIVFTADIQEKGQWGGITLAGRAPVNFGIGEGAEFEQVSPAIAEVRNIPYGGDTSGDSSGILNYVRVEYGGAQLTPESEFNAFSFYGVGSGTTLTNLQAYYGKDDGFEFFGGTVNASNLIATGSGDDSVDWTEGWTGTVSNVYITLENDADSGFEGDGNGLNNGATPASNPQISNVTIIGTDGVGEGINLREGTNVFIDNVYLEGFDGASSDRKYIEIDSDNTTGYITDGTFRLTNINFNNPTAGLKIDFDSVYTDVAFDGFLSDLGLDGFTESTSTGAGNGASTPDWATGWATGL